MIISEAALIVSLRLALAAVLVAAAVGKLVSLPRFANAVRNYQILGPAGSAAVAIVLPPIELVVGVCLLLAISPTIMAGVAATLFALLAIPIVINLLRGRADVDCGCFSRSRGLSWRLVLRNGLFATVGLILAVPSLRAALILLMCVTVALDLLIRSLQPTAKIAAH